MEAIIAFFLFIEINIVNCPNQKQADRISILSTNNPTEIQMFEAKAALLVFLSMAMVQAQSTDPDIAGWTLLWSDEFDGTELDREKWTPDTGYFLNSDPGTWGWGNDELEYYSDSPKNVYVKDGYLNLTAFKDRKNWTNIDPNRYAQYASGKVITRGKFSWKYGRIDFRASVPAGQGFWPALWMMPQDNFYGGWALSGEIDVMEVKGSIQNKSSGAIHFGGAWPDNAFLSGEYTFPAGKTIADFNVYTLIWEEAEIRWYVNGNLFYKAKNNQWKSNASNAQGNAYAPFDKEFYIIMNLAVGGHFDGYKIPPDNALPATMRVDYVRVYKPSSNPTIFVISAPTISLQEVQNSARLDIYSLNGKLKKTLNFKGGIIYNVSLDDLPKGVYIAKITSNKETKCQKIILR
ncbi:MAG: family 16 glycosylhydrolase [Fibromonadales bacterium]|nr:family 16 glycosylhydrolase [Fibromonadales bacterium]